MQGKNGQQPPHVACAPSVVPVACVKHWIGNFQACAQPCSGLREVQCLALGHARRGQGHGLYGARRMPFPQDAELSPAPAPLLSGSPSLLTARVSFDLHKEDSSFQQGTASWVGLSAPPSAFLLWLPSPPAWWSPGKVPRKTSSVPIA